MKTTIALIGVFSLCGCALTTPAVLIGGYEAYKAVKTAVICPSLENLTEEGKQAIRDKVTDGKQVYQYCPGDK